MTTYDQGRYTEAATPRIETVGDGMSAAALITAWVGAAIPLLPAVALLVALAGRKRSLTRWLNSLAIAVSAIFLAAQIIVPLAFGGLLMAGLSNLTNRSDDPLASAVADELVPGIVDAPVAQPTEDTAPAAEDAPADDYDLSEVSPVTTMPGENADLDTVYLDTMSSAMEDTGFSPSDFDQSFLYRVAGDTCVSLDGGGTLEDAARSINDQDIPRAVAGTIASVAIVSYCPQHADAL